MTAVDSNDILAKVLKNKNPKKETKKMSEEPPAGDNASQTGDEGAVQAPGAPVSPAEKMQQLSGDAEYLASMDPDKLSPEDREAYDELVAHRKADFEANADAIRGHVTEQVKAADADLQERLSSGDHNVR